MRYPSLSTHIDQVPINKWAQITTDLGAERTGPVSAQNYHGDLRIAIGGWATSAEEAVERATYLDKDGADTGVPVGQLKKRNG